jgi:hypothetical protein
MCEFKTIITQPFYKYISGNKVRFASNKSKRRHSDRSKGSIDEEGKQSKL